MDNTPEKNSWLVCMQTHWNTVKYQTSEGNHKYPTYMDFLHMMMGYSIKDPQNFRKQLDTFKLLYVDLITGEWEELKIDARDDYSFEELLNYNQKIAEKENRKDNFISNVEKGKNWIFGRKKT